MSANDQEYDRKAGLDQLTDEERAAIEEDDLTEQERAAMQEIVASGEEEEAEEEIEEEEEESPGTDGIEGSGDAAADKAAMSEEGSDDKSKPEPEPEPETEEEAPVARRAAYQANLPEDFNDKLEALDTAEQVLTKKFKDGDIDADEFLRENKRISGERNDLERLRTKAEIAEEMGAQSAEQEWSDSVASFFRQVKKDEGIDYATDKEKLSDFDGIVKALAAKPENADKSFSWYLNKAHKATKALHDISDKPAEKQPESKESKPDSRKPPADKLPKTLAHVPGSDGPGDVGDEFADLDSLEGDDFERALAKMTPAQRERYLAAA